MRPSMKQNRQGFTLMEISIVLGIVGLIIGTIWTAASSVTANNQIKKAAIDVIQILNNYRALYATRAVDVSNLTDITCVGVTAGYFPADMVQAGSSCTASASGTLTYTGATVKAPFSNTSSVQVQAYQNPQGIIVSFYNLSQAQCISVAMRITTLPDVIWESIDDMGNGNSSNTQFVNNTISTSGTINSGTLYNITSIKNLCASAASQDAGQTSATTYQPNGNMVQVMFKVR